MKTKYKIGDIIKTTWSGKKWEVVGIKLMSKEYVLKSFDTKNVIDATINITEDLTELDVRHEQEIGEQKDQEWNAICPLCGAPAYKGFLKTECSKCKGNENEN